LQAAASELHFSPISFLKLWKKEPYVIVYRTVETTWNAVEKVDIFTSDEDWAVTNTEYKELFSKLRIIGSNLYLIGLILPEEGSITSDEFPITQINCLYKVTVSLVIWRWIIL